MNLTDSLIGVVDRLHGKARYFVASIALMGALLIGSSVVAWQFSREQARLAEAHAQTLLVLRAAHGVKIATLDTLRAQRGFLLTGETDYLRPYMNGRSDLSANLATLDRLTSDDPKGNASARRLRDAAEIYLAQLGQVVSVAKSGDLARARQLVERVGISDGIDTIDAGIDRVIKGERSNLYALTAHVDRFTVTTLRFIYLNSFVGLCLLVLAVLSARALRHSAERERSYREELRKRAENDDLTGVSNRRELLNYLDVRIAEARRLDTPLSFAMFDIDNFKRVNDSHGHAVGDEAIRHVVRSAQGTIRINDRIGRMGGEEFGIVLPKSSEENAYGVCERMLAALHESPFAVGDGQTLHITISTGIAALTAEDDAASLIERADQALYEAKRSGRDQVKLAA